MNPKNFIPLGIGVIAIAAIIFAGQSGLLKQAGKLQKADVADTLSGSTPTATSFKTGWNIFIPDAPSQVSNITGCDLADKVYVEDDAGVQTPVTELEKGKTYWIKVASDCEARF